MARLDSINAPGAGFTRPNIRVIPPRNPYRTLTASSGYPAAFGIPVSGSYLVIRDDEENSSSWPS